jgi:hypothetical protein
MLLGVDEPTALAVAERIRSRTESTLISLAPGITDRISVSIGIATAPHAARDRVALLRLADEALYRAKQAGRNRVEYVVPIGQTSGGPVEVARSARRSSARGRASRTHEPTARNAAS